MRLQDYTEAFRLFSHSANANNAEAQYQLANLYQQGIGTKVNPTLALSWMEKAAAQEYPAAQYTLGLRLLDSDPAQAEILIRQSALQEYSAAVLYLARDVQSVGSISEGAEWETSWVTAAKKDDMKKIQGLVQSGQVDWQDSHGRTALLFAAEFGSERVAGWLLENGADPLHIDKVGNSSASIAINTQNISVLKLLVKKPGVLSTTLPNGDSLLHFSLRTKNIPAAELLLHSHIDISRANKEGWTALDFADYHQLSSVKQKIIASGGKPGNKWKSSEDSGDAKQRIADLYDESKIRSINLQDAAGIVVSKNIALLERSASGIKPIINDSFADGSNLLMLATDLRASAELNFLLRNGANPNLLRNDGITVLHLAARNGDEKNIRTLLIHHADPEIKSTTGIDAVEYALVQQQPASALLMLHFLIEGGKFSRSKNSHYLLAASQANLTDVVALLLKNNADVAVTDAALRSPLWFAAINNNRKMADDLILHGADPEQKDREGKTPFYVAVEAGAIEAASVTLTTNNLDQSSMTGWNPLMVAASKGHAKIINWLVAKNAQIDARNDLGDTALIIAVKASQWDSVSELMTAGANPARKNKIGLSALSIVEKQNPDKLALIKGSSRFKLF